MSQPEPSRPRLTRRGLVVSTVAAGAAVAASSVAIRSCAGPDAPGGGSGPTTPDPTSVSPSAAAPDLPSPLGRLSNILLITLDDLGGDTLGCFGGPADISPHIDRLAAEGVVFERAHVPVSVCQPSRSALMTGLFPHRNGATGFGPIRAGVPVLNDVLREQGYRTGILSKVDHIEPVQRFQWDLSLGEGALGDGRDPDAYADAAREFFTTAKDDDAPFFLMVNSDDPHRPFYGADPGSGDDESTGREVGDEATPSQVYDAASVETPGFLPDLPEVRTELAQYESSTRRADDTVGAVLAELTAAGLDEDTLVILFSDNGMAFPFAKANCWHQSTQTPLVVRWPGLTEPGRRVEAALVSTIDLFPTMVRAAGGSLPPRLDGTDLTGLLSGEDQNDRGKLHTVFHQTASGQDFEMRAVTDGEWHYIWNAWSDGSTTYTNESQHGLTWPAMTAAAATDPAVKARTDLFTYRVPEELYRLTDDPDSLENLVPASSASASAAVVAALDEARRATYDWMRSKGDPQLSSFTAQVMSGS